MVKLIGLLFFASLLFSSAGAQDVEGNNGEKSVHEGFFAFGGIGPAIPVGDFGSERDTGFDLNTAISYQFHNRFLIRGMFDFSSFNFDRGAITQTVGNETYELGGSNNLISLNVSGGYYLPTGRLSPYVFAGIGASFLSKPEVEIDENQNFIDMSLDVGAYFSTVAGAGLDFILNPPKEEEDKESSPLIIYLETFYTYIPADTDVSQHKFQLLTFNVGIKTKM